MPELPEVETARRLSERHLTGRRMIDVEVRLPKLLRDSPLPDAGILVGRTVLGARRRAKVFVLDVDADLSLMIHFKLAGQWAILLPNGTRAVAGHPVPDPSGPYPHKASHATLRFDDGTVVHYSDVRQFGWWRILPATSVADAIRAFGFGPEGTGEDWDVQALSDVMARRGIPIKTLLLDQTFIAGLGNIYVDEALHAARVHPARPARSLDERERLALLAAVPWALEEGIRQGGARILHARAFPVDNFPAVHGREGEPCFRCGTRIEKTRVGQRGTYYCPACQPLAP